MIHRKNLYQLNKFHYLKEKKKEVSHCKLLISKNDFCFKIEIQENKNDQNFLKSRIIINNLLKEEKRKRMARIQVTINKINPMNKNL